MSKKGILILVAMLLISVVVFFGTTNKPAHAGQVLPTNKVVKRTVVKHHIVHMYHGYRMECAYPSIKTCLAYTKHHTGANRWRMFIIRAEYQQIYNAVTHVRGWKHVWNPEWVVQDMFRESSGIPTAKNGVCWGLMQINFYLHNTRNPYQLLNPEYNINLAAKMFASPSPNGGFRPWLSSCWQVRLAPYVLPVG